MNCSAAQTCPSASTSVPNLVSPTKSGNRLRIVFRDSESRSSRQGWNFRSVAAEAADEGVEAKADTLEDVVNGLDDVAAEKPLALTCKVSRLKLIHFMSW